MTKIEWADTTWNPIVGCTKVSAGCKNCYAERMAKRLVAMGQERYGRVITDGRWNGTTRFQADHWSTRGMVHRQVSLHHLRQRGSPWRAPHARLFQSARRCRRCRMSDTFGQLLRKRRQQAGLTLTEMAERLQVSVPYLSDVERGNRRPLITEKALAASSILGCGDDELVLAAARERCPDCAAALARITALKKENAELREQNNDMSSHIVNVHGVADPTKWDGYAAIMRENKRLRTAVDGALLALCNVEDDARGGTQ